MIQLLAAKSLILGGELDRKQKLDAAIKNILRHEGVPPFALNANELIAGAADPDGSSADLTRVILKDLGLTSQILRTANSSMYNRSGRSILNMAHAVALLGWENICNLINALRFVDHFSSHSPGLRELMMAALMTAAHGRQVAASIGYPKPEEAYICSLFRNLGEVLIARYYPREYSEVVIAIDREKLAERTACLRVLNFTWDEIAMNLAGRWNLPHQISLCLASPGRFASTNAMDRSLASIASYGQALTTALYRKATHLDAVHLSPVIDLKGNPHLISPRSLHRIVNNALEDTKQTFSALRIPINTLQLERQVEAAQVLLTTMPASHTDLEIAEETVSANDFNLTPFIVESLGLLVRCGFQHALFALVNEQRDMVRGRLAAGAELDSTLERFSFPVTKSDRAMDAALLRRQDLLVDCATDGSYSRSGLGMAFRPAIFGLYPVIVDNLVIGCIYADVGRRDGAIPKDLRAHLSDARDRIAAALKKVRSGA